MTKAMNIRADGSWTGQALIKLEEMAAAGRTQATIAAFFELPKKEFENLLGKNKGRNEVRIAWERGRARVEQQLYDAMWAEAMGTVVEEPELVDVRGPDGKPTGEKHTILVRKTIITKGGSTLKIFMSKAQFGWKEGESAESKVSNVTLMLPKPRSRAEFFAIMDIEDPKQAAAKLAGPAELKTVEALPLDRPSDETIRERVRELTTPKGTIR